MNRKTLWTLVFAASSMPAMAQTPAAPAPAGPPVLPPEKSIALNLALEAVQTAVDSCKASKSLAAIELMDLNYNIKVMLVADGARPNLNDTARRKAYTVIKKGMSSGDLAKQLGKRQRRDDPPIEGDPSLLASPGALPIMRGNTMIAALSVSGDAGPEIDEACAQAGIDKIKGRL
jgi:uncharacterized protein GlcG (DUF336 family)